MYLHTHSPVEGPATVGAHAGHSACLDTQGLGGCPCSVAGAGGMPTDRHAMVTEIRFELQLVALSFSGAPAN